MLATIWERLMVDPDDNVTQALIQESPSEMTIANASGRLARLIRKQAVIEAEIKRLRELLKGAL
jgi:hypothetical protein